MKQGHHRPSDFDDFTSHKFSEHLKRFRDNAKARRHLFYQGIRFSSQAEISCAKALEKYCGWECKEGLTYQVPIGHSKHCDFRVNGVLVEFHPTILSRELHSPAYRLLQEALEGAREATRRDVRAAIKLHLYIEYVDKRDWSVRLNHDADIRDAELIVVPGAAEFYREVVKRFAVRAVPKERDFVRMFKQGRFK